MGWTVAAEGLLAADAGQKFGLHAYIGDHSVTSGKIELRFVHASAGTPSVDVGIGIGSSFAALFSNVAFGSFGMGSGIDARGYLETSPASNVTIVARQTGTQTDALVIPSVTIAEGGIVTAFAVGNAAGAPLKVQLCSDVDASTAPWSNCSLVP